MSLRNAGLFGEPLHARDLRKLHTPLTSKNKPTIVYRRVPRPSHRNGAAARPQTVARSARDSAAVGGKTVPQPAAKCVCVGGGGRLFSILIAIDALRCVVLHDRLIVLLPAGTEAVAETLKALLATSRHMSIHMSSHTSKRMSAHIY